MKSVACTVHTNTDTHTTTVQERAASCCVFQENCCIQLCLCDVCWYWNWSLEKKRKTRVFSLSWNLCWRSEMKEKSHSLSFHRFLCWWWVSCCVCYRLCVWLGRIIVDTQNAQNINKPLQITLFIIIFSLSLFCMRLPCCDVDLMLFPVLFAKLQIFYI